MSELVREALRQYDRNRWWDEVNAFGRKSAEKAGVRTEEDVVEAVHEFRRKKKSAKRA